jgi:DNA-directed RNA polymerase subunit beta'
MIEGKQKTFFRNKIITKKYLQEILFWSFKNFGIARAAFLADSLKKLGFYFATQAGISISIEDLKVPTLKTGYVENANQKIEKIEFALNSGKITKVEKYQQLTDNWNITSEKLKNEIVNFFKNFDPLNPIYMMAFSGARGNLSQIRQLVGIRGLMAGPSGNIIDIPITKNFREGLSSTDYMISAYGARKGLVDTALKTADCGYLTRRLIDVAQDVLIRETECYTNQGIYLFKLDTKKGKVLSLKDRILGRILAKDIIDSNLKKIIGLKNQQINSLIIKKIEQNNLKKIIVRSPLTCQLNRSVCKNCYGWNLSNGKLVDLGEAVGIIAAQSIGEPGTQLTMRTFHTGGIFSSDSNYQIFSKVSGQVLFPKQLKTFPIRTPDGKNVLNIELSATIEVVTFKNQIIKIFLKKDTLLFVKNKEFIKKNQLIAYLPENLQSLGKKGKKILSSNISGEIIFNKKLDKIDSTIINNIEKKITNGLIWILSGKVFNLPFSAKIIKYKFSNLNNVNSIASTKFISYKSGYFKILLKDNYLNNNKYEIKLLAENFIINNFNLYSPTNQNKFLNKNYKYLSIFSLDKINFFYLTKQLKLTIKKHLTVGDLINTKFKTKVSGIIYFLKIKTNLINNKLKTYNIKEGGGIFYLPEETFFINKDISYVFIKNKNYIKSNTKITKNIYNKNPGFVEIISSNNIVNKIIIKSGYYLTIKSNQIDLSLHKKLFFKGEKIFEIYEIQQLTYSEVIKNSNSVFLLLRPIFLYEIPKKLEKKTYKIKNNKANFFEFNYTNFKHKEKVIVQNKSLVNLIKTDLNILTNKKNLNNFIAEIGFNKIKKHNFSLECNIFENIFSKINFRKNIEFPKFNVLFFVKNKQYIEPYTLIGNIEFIPNIKGKIKNIKEKKQTKFRRLLITLSDDYKKIFTENKVKINKNFIATGNILSSNLLSLDSGIVKKITSNKIEICRANPFLFSEGAEIFWQNKDFIKENENLGVLFYNKAQTGDIIQGLPKIEEILEARKPKIIIEINPGLILDSIEKKLSFFYLNNNFQLDINFYSSSIEKNIYVKNKVYMSYGHLTILSTTNPHIRLKYLNDFYKKFLSPYKSAYRSLRKIQSFLLNSIQCVYFSQGVTISDKHLEIIIKQITSKVKVKDKGDSSILSGEYIDLQQIYNMNKILKRTKSQKILYEPILLGITKASLKNQSFTSASSFQETITILTNAAIQGKVDWLRGLKENVIVGRLIPAGTGFNIYEQICHLNTILPKLVLSK